MPATTKAQTAKANAAAETFTDAEGDSGQLAQALVDSILPFGTELWLHVVSSDSLLYDPWHSPMSMSMH